MTAENRERWNEANQRYLTALLNTVRAELEFYRSRRDEQQADEPAVRFSGAETELRRAADALPAPSALDALVRIFGLSTFECKILLMCAGVELDAQFSSLLADVQGSAPPVRPSFGLALAAFPDAHWSALSPGSPLRYWRLIELDPRELITRGPLRIDEHILHYLTGVNHFDERLREVFEPLFPESYLAPSQTELADDIARARTAMAGNGLSRVIRLTGHDAADKKAVGALACNRMELDLFSLSALSVPLNPKEAAEILRLWNREAALNSCALYLDCASLEAGDKPRAQAVADFAGQVQGVLIVGGGEWMPDLKRQKIEYRVGKPTFGEQVLLWKKNLGDRGEGMEEQLREIAAHFNLSAHTIDAASREAPANPKERDPVGLGEKIWRACCVHTRPGVDELAQRIEPVAVWDDLVLPDSQKQILNEIARQVKHRRQVYHEWGFAGKGARGLGISVLFSGESGTGKTMAAEVLANELRLDLYRIDLSQVVNKYIGETEKNLKRIFDAAEEGGAILLFDEADALFGKRSDVKDSHDRYSNIEVSYLLQRMEAYRGLAVLTTNMRNAIDKAFLRRIRFVVQFPFPDAVLRAEIWKRVFPADTPVEDLDPEKLARLNVPGGNIRNIAMNAAFLAADEGRPVRMSHVLRAARSEYQKLDKALSSNETRGWS